MQLLATAQAVGAKVGGAGFARVSLLNKQVLFIIAILCGALSDSRVCLVIDSWIFVYIHFQAPARQNNLIGTIMLPLTR